MGSGFYGQGLGFVLCGEIIRMVGQAWGNKVSLLMVY